MQVGDRVRSRRVGPDDTHIQCVGTVDGLWPTGETATVQWDSGFNGVHAVRDLVVVSPVRYSDT